MAVAVRNHTAKANAATLTPGGDKPTGTAAGDLLISQIVCRTPTTTITAPSGWTLIGTRQAGTANIAEAIAWKIADAADVAAAATNTWLWTLGGSVQSNVAVIAFTGANGTPIDQNSQQANASSTTDTAPTITPTAAGMIVMFSSSGAVSNTWTGPTQLGGGWTEQYDFLGGTASSTWRSFAMHYKQNATLSATGSVTTTLSTAGVNIGRLVQIKEAPATTPVSSDRVLSYDVAAQVASSRVLSFDVAAQVASTRALSFDVRVPVASDRVLSFDISAAVASQRVLLFDVIGRVSSDRVLSFDVRTVAGSNRSLSYDVRTPAASERVLLYDALLLAGASRTVAFDVAAAVGSSRVLSYDVRQLVASDRVLLYDVAGTLALVSSDRSILFDVAALAGSQRVLSFDVRVPAASERVLAFDVLTGVQSDRSVLYDVLARTWAERELLYDVLIRTASERDFLFDVIAQVGSERVILFDVESLASEADGIFIVRVPAERTIEVVRPEGFERVAPEKTIETVER